LFAFAILFHDPLGWGIMDWWPSSVCPSVCPVPDHKSITEERSKLKIGRKEARDTGDPWPVSKYQRSRSPGRLTPWPKNSDINGTKRPTNFKLGIWRWSTTTRVTNLRDDVQPESSGWLLIQVTACRGRGILWRPNYRLHSLL